MSDSKILDSSKLVVQDNSINSLNGLSIVEKERIILMFREATLRGFDIKGIPMYIKSQIGIQISVKLVLKLRRLVTIQDRKWYITYAKDQYAYIGVYRKCIDELDSLRKECWRLIMLNTTREETKIAAMREIHNIVKTQVLLIRDLPFIMDLSKYYDPTIIDIGDKKPKTIIKLGNNQPDHDKTHEHPLNSHLHKVLFNAVNNQNLKDLPASLPHKVLAEVEDRRKEVFKNVDDEILDSITDQLAGMTESDKERYDIIEKQKKTEEDNQLKTVIKQYEDGLREEFKNSGGKLSLERVEELQDKAQSSIDYINAITTEKERNTIKKLKEIRDD